MDFDGQANEQHDNLPESQSFGRKNQPLSYSRKISVGVVDAFDKSRTSKVNQDEAAAVIQKDVFSSKGGHVKDIFKEEGLIISSTVKLLNSPRKQISPSASIYSGKPTSEEVCNVKQGSETTNKFCTTPDGAEKGPLAYSMQFFTNQISTMQCSKGKHESIRTQVAEDDTAQNAYDNSFTAAQRMFEDKETAEGQTIRMEANCSETLRMKLREILGNVSSLEKKDLNTQDLDMGEKGSHQEQKDDGNGKHIDESRQSSDSIESDSESHDHVGMRPMGRSFPQNRYPTEVRQKRTENRSYTLYGRDCTGYNTVSFKDGCAGRCTTTGDFLSGERIEKESTSAGNETENIWSHVKDSNEEKQGARHKRKPVPCPEKLSLLGNRTVDICNLHQKLDSKIVEQKGCVMEIDSMHSPVRKVTEQVRDLDFLSSMNVLGPEYDLQSPTFEKKTYVGRCSTDSPAGSKLGEVDIYSPIGMSVNMKGPWNFKSSHTSKAHCYLSSVAAGSSNDEEEKDSKKLKSVPTLGIDATTNMSKSSLETYSESSEGCSLIKNRWMKSKAFCPESNAAVELERCQRCPRPSKRLCKQASFNFSEPSPALHFQGGTEEVKNLHMSSEQDQDDGLASNVALCALALRKVTSRMKAVTSERSAKILMHAAESIHLQLHNAESQVQSDLVKLNNLSKTKRRQLESTLQVQQEQLKAIYERFNEEITQHIQNCRNTLEGVEAQELGLKRTIDRQKASHRKLLLQAEAAIENELNVAQQRITGVYNLGREKILQLKRAVAHCLREGALS